MFLGVTRTRLHLARLSSKIKCSVDRLRSSDAPNLSEEIAKARHHLGGKTEFCCKGCADSCETVGVIRKKQIVSNIIWEKKKKSMDTADCSGCRLIFRKEIRTGCGQIFSKISTKSFELRAVWFEHLHSLPPRPPLSGHTWDASAAREVLEWRRWRECKCASTSQLRA